MAERDIRIQDLQEKIRQLQEEHDLKKLDAGFSEVKLARIKQDMLWYANEIRNTP